MAVIRERLDTVYLASMRLALEKGKGNISDLEKGIHTDFEKALAADKDGYFDGDFGRTQVTAVIYKAGDHQTHELSWQEFVSQGRSDLLQFLLSGSYAPSGLTATRSDKFEPLYLVRP